MPGPPREGPWADGTGPAGPPTVMRMHPRNVWQAMSRPGFLLSAWPWRAAAYLSTGAVTGAVVLVGIVTAAAVCSLLVVVLVGLPCSSWSPSAGSPWPGWSGTGCAWSTATRCPARTGCRPRRGCGPG